MTNELSTAQDLSKVYTVKYVRQILSDHKISLGRIAMILDQLLDHSNPKIQLEAIKVALSLGRVREEMHADALEGHPLTGVNSINTLNMLVVKSGKERGVLDQVLNADADEMAAQMIPQGKQCIMREAGAEFNE